MRALLVVALPLVVIGPATSGALTRHVLTANAAELDFRFTDGHSDGWSITSGRGKLEADGTKPLTITVPARAKALLVSPVQHSSALLSPAEVSFVASVPRVTEARLELAPLVVSSTGVVFAAPPVAAASTLTWTSPGQASTVDRFGIELLNVSGRSASLELRSASLKVQAEGSTGAPANSVPPSTTSASPSPSALTGAGTAATGNSGGGAPSPPLPDSNAPGPWQLVFNSDFSQGSLDPSQWSTGWPLPGETYSVNATAQSCNEPSMVQVGAGVLSIGALAATTSCGGTTEPYESGIISTNGKFQFTYGYFEASIWLPAVNDSIADWPAFWADGQVWPQDGEIDVVEGLWGAACWHFHDPSGAPGGCASSTYTGGWHTFGADWEPGSVTYYYDGTEVGQVTSGVTSAPMYLVLDFAVPTAWSPVSPSAMLVSYVRVWQHG